MGSTFQINSLLAKTKDVDQDLRYMALSDLLTELKRPCSQIDEATETAMVNQVLLSMEDTNTEVKNAAVKVLGQLVQIVQEQHVIIIIERITSHSLSSQDELRDISNLALRTVVKELSPASSIGYNACANLIPKLLQQLQNPNSCEDVIIGALEILSDLFARFEAMVAATPEIQLQAQSALVSLLTHRRNAIRKRTVDALGFWAASVPEDLLLKLIDQSIAPYLESTGERVQTSIDLIGSVVNRTPQKVGKSLPHLIPKVIKATEQDDDSLREDSLKTLERIITQCPQEAAPFLQTIVDAATKLIKYDPNYSGDIDDDDEDMASDEDDEFDDHYSDDEDVSFKVRKAAAKVFSAVLGCRPDSLSLFYKQISVSLLSCFSERQEAVRLEIWQTYTKLLRLVKVYSQNNSYIRAESPGNLKRKRSTDDESPVTFLKEQVPTVVKALSKQLDIKGNQGRGTGFVLLRTLVDVVQGGLESHFAALSPRIITALNSADASIISGSATNLKLEVLSFLGVTFITHSPTTYESFLSQLVPPLVTCCEDKYNKVSSESFSTCCCLIRALRPVQKNAKQTSPISKSFAEHILKIHAAVVRKLESHAADQEVKEAGVRCLSECFYHAGDIVDVPRSLSLLQDLLKKELTRFSSVKAIAHCTPSPTLNGTDFDPWIQNHLVEIASYLRQSNKSLLHEVFVCLPVILSRVGAGTPQQSLEELLAYVQPYITDTDLHRMPLALETVNAVLQTNCAVARTQTFQNTILPSAYILVRSSMMTGFALDTLLNFFGALVQSGANPSQVIDDITVSIGSDPRNATSATTTTTSHMKPNYSAAAKAIGVVSSYDLTTVLPTANKLLNSVKAQNTTPQELTFNMLTLGELGHLQNFSSQDEFFNTAYEFFSHQSNEVRTAASFAVGNMAVGSPEKLSQILSNVEKTGLKQLESEQNNMCELSLLALKEFISHTPATKLSEFADTLWKTMFTICRVDAPPPAATIDSKDEEAVKVNDEQRKIWKTSEAVRVVASECLGKITLIDPFKYMNELQHRLNDPVAGVRSAVILAIRFTLNSESNVLEECLASLMVPFFSIINDTDLDVRKATLTTLNAAAHHKPQLVQNHLSALLGAVYQETVVNEKLIRKVVMGPYTHKYDEGLECRKTAYECLYTFLDTCTSKIDSNEYMTRILAGINDEYEIRAICYLMVVRLSSVAPTTVMQRLDDVANVLLSTLKLAPAKNAVKQEEENLMQMQEAALRAFVVLSRLANEAISPKFCTAVNEIRINQKWRTKFEELIKSESEANVPRRDGMDID